MNVSWAVFKSIATLKAVSIQYLDLDDRYWLQLFDGNFVLECLILKAAEPGSVTDFEANFKPAGNQPISPSSGGIPLSRGIVTKAGWHFEPRCISFTSAKAGSLHNHKSDGFSISGGTSIGDATLKFFNSSGTELVVGEGESAEDYQARLATDCTCTIMDWQATYDMEILRGKAAIIDGAGNLGYAYVNLAPDLPAIYGGNVPFMNGGLDLRFLANQDAVTFDGAGSKFLAYDPVYKTNKFRLKKVHVAGEQIGFMAVFEHFKA